MATFSDNDVSASSARPRPAFEKMLDAAEHRDIDVVIAWHADRLARKITDLERVVVLAERTGLRVATVSGDLDLGTDAGRLVARILVSVARGETERKGARQRRANRQRAESGLPRTNVRRSFGYQQDCVTVVEHEAEMIREAYTTVLAGAASSASLKQWQEIGVPTLQGGKMWREQVVRQILLNPRNAGLVSYLGEVVSKGSWPAIIDEATWDATRVLLTDPSRRKTVNAPKRTRLLSGLVRCGVCGETVKAASRPTDGARTYRCRGGKHVIRQALPLEEYVRDHIIGRLNAPDARKLLDDPDAPDMAHVRREVVNKRKRLETLAVEYASGNIGKPALVAGSQVLNASIEELETQLVRDSALILLPLLGRAEELWDDLDLHRQRAVINALCTSRCIPSVVVTASRSHSRR